ncbi:hypothetical protein RN001_008179 [Aquatica leii]|uniref:DDE Tnp4 domain-containing protein n=1 Tax=Aquatica leii TaxID=1421715 RepID=A0AAN7SP58_9COLE|nr:hypothetical protein RN001_008179 [Aquatica leii]
MRTKNVTSSFIDRFYFSDFSHTGPLIYANRFLRSKLQKLLFTIWTLSKPDSFIAAGYRFNLAKSTSHNIFFEIVTLIANLRHSIFCPNQNERERISRTLENKSGIPGVIGAIDGCHVAIKAPSHNSVDYYNRNNYHSMILQAVCNDRRQFINIFVGTPGRVHDGLDIQLVTHNEHLLGDAAYPLLRFLLKPYRDNGHLTNAEVRFNARMSSVRSLIKQAFGLLKDMIPSVITAVCVLHNIIIINDGFDAKDAEQNILHQGQNADIP